MNAIISAVAMLLASGCAWIIYHMQGKQGARSPWIFYYLSFTLPFAVGGFHTYTAVITTVLLLINLYSLYRKQHRLRIFCNLNMAAILLVTISYCITPIWAADKGMAVFGIPRYLPLLLYALTLMQYTAEEKTYALSLVPLCGVIMTLCSCILILVPGVNSYVLVKERLSGFMEYPNIFATFLLAGLVVNGTKEIRGRMDILMDAVLILGVVLSGSQTGFILLLVSFIGLIWIRRDNKALIAALGVCFLCGLMLAVAAADLDLIKNADRFTTISVSSKSFQLRLLYYKDALTLILKNPFGLGYLGFRAVEGSIQTGVYSTAYVHNGFLQMMLDIGWIPSILMVLALVRAMLTRQIAAGYRLLLLVILGHCMLDFNLQFFVIWVILLSTLDFCSGKEYTFLIRKAALATACSIVTAACIWLGIGDLCYQTGNFQTTLKIVPFHTNALSTALTAAPNAASADVIADQILKLNATNSLAYSAKANMALTRGDVLAMIEYKEHAISCARYSIVEYQDYFEKLYAAMELYLKSGDLVSAQYCLNILNSIPEMIATVNDGTTVFAPTDDLPLELPMEYQQILSALSGES